MSFGIPPPLPYGTQGFNQTGNPWFNVANQFTPRNLHDIIKWSRYITVQSPTTTEVIRKQASYPITSFVEDTKDKKLSKKYHEIYKSIKLKESLQNIGFEYFSLGNAFLSVYLPIQRDLKCPVCGTHHNIKQADFVRFKAYKFVGTCPKCNGSGNFEVVDRKSFNVDDINLIRWTPEHMVVNFNPITGEKEYYYKIPNNIKMKIQRGDRLFLNSIPWGFIEAVRYNQDFKFDKGAIFHLENVSIGGSVEGVAVPPMLSLFSLVFYQATLRKANEAIATEYLTPLRIVFPQAQTGNSDPVVSMSMRNFKDNMESALLQHKKDKNHILVAPTPVGYSTVGGEGRNLLVSQEIAQAEQQILLSLGVSQELLSGTSNWTSSSVGLRMLENTLYSYTTRMEDLINWTMGKITAYLKIETVEVSMIPFKLLDDDNYRNLLGTLAQAGKTSYTTLFEDMGLDFMKELEKMTEEQAAQASSEIRTQYEIEQAKFLAAKKAGEDFREDEEYQTALSKAEQTAQQLFSTDESTRRSFMLELRKEDYAQWLMVSKMIDEMRKSPENQAATAQNVSEVAAATDGGGVGSGADVDPNAPVGQTEAPAAPEAPTTPTGTI